MAHSDVLAAVLSTYADERLVADPAGYVTKAALVADLAHYATQRGYPQVDAPWLGRLLSAHYGDRVRPYRMGPTGRRVQAWAGLTIRAR